jgi:outer membrane protein TolC
MPKQNSRHVQRFILAAAVAVAVAAPPAGAQTLPQPGTAVPLPDPALLRQVAQTGSVLELSMQEAVDLALQHNLGLEQARMDLDIASNSISAQRALFLPQTNASFSRNASSNPALENADGTVNITSTTQLTSSTGMSQSLPWFGTSYSASWSAYRRETPGSRSTFNPSLSSSFSFNVTQPLWRGLTTDQARSGLESSQRQRAITDLRVQDAMVRLETQVRSQYLTLVAERETYAVAVQNLEVAEQALRNSQARVDVGVAPETDVIGDEAQVAGSRVEVIAAEARIAAAEDALRSLILDPNRQDYWDVSLVPTEEIALTPREISLEGTIQEAIANRIDRQIAHRGLDLTDLNLRVSRDSTRPDLDLTLNYSASGSGGRRTTGELSDRSFGAVLGEAFGGDYPNWTTRLQFAYPIGRSSAEASYASAQIQRRQQVLDLQQLDLQIVQQVRNAVRQVENSFRRVEAARAALDASQQNLEAEQRKLAVGLSTSLNLQFQQQQLANARIRELNAIIAYNRALIDLDRVVRIQ